MEFLKFFILLLMSVVSINAGYDYSNYYQGYYYPTPNRPRLSYEGGGFNEMASYMTTGNAGGQDMKAYASQQSANYASAPAASIGGGHSNGFQTAETIAAITAAATAAKAAQQAQSSSSLSSSGSIPYGSSSSDHSVSINAETHNAAKLYAAGNNIYGANSEQFLPAYTSSYGVGAGTGAVDGSGYEDNHLSSASNDYSNAGISLGNEHHSNGYDKFQSALYSNTNPAATVAAPAPTVGNIPATHSDIGIQSPHSHVVQFSHGNQNAVKTLGGLFDTSAVEHSILHHYGRNGGISNTAAAGHAAYAAAAAAAAAAPAISTISQISHQPQYIYGKAEAIPISKHIQITRHIPVPIYKQIHIPYQKPVKVQIPHPVLIPVPQPYPIKVPITKPYAVPLVQELTIPIEKIVPYAVEKKIPFPIEKHVPYPVEKHIPIAVPYPYPVKVPVVKTVLHKAKTHGWN